MLIVNNRIRIPLEEFEFSYARSGGPGGQNVNKVNSKALLRWPVAVSPSLPEPVRQRFLLRFANRVTVDGDLVLTSQRFRDAPRNTEDCLEKLRAMIIEVATIPKARKATRPTRGSVERRHEDKRQQADKKRDRRKTGHDD